MTRDQLIIIAPELALTVTALGILMVSAFARAKSAAWSATLAKFGLLATGYLTLHLWNEWTRAPQEPFAMMRGDGTACFFNLLFVIGALIAVFISDRFTGGDELVRPLTAEYYVLLLLSTTGMMVMAGSNDLLMVFLGLETLSIPLYVLAGFARGKPLSIEASLKYFLLGAFATGFLLFGIALIFATTTTTDLGLLSGAATVIARQQGNHEVYLLCAGIALLLIGLMFKVALVPFHQWTPDVYEGSPTPITAFMSVGSKAAGFAATMRIFGGDDGFALLAKHWDGLLWVIAATTVIVANVAALAQQSLKRMLGYSGIAHAGYVLIGFLIHNDEGTAAILFYLMAYTFMNLGAFTIIVLFGDEEKGDLTLQQCCGLAERHLPAALAMTVFMLALAGIPPTAGFFAKFYLFRAALGLDSPSMTALTILALLCSVVSVFYYLRPSVMMFMRESNPQQAKAAPSFGLSLALAICMAGVLGFGFYSHSLFNFAHGSFRSF